MDLPYTVVIFDVKETLRDNHSHRTDTLVATLTNLKALGVQLYAVSSTADTLPHYGFPEGLITPIEPLMRTKAGAVTDLIKDGLVDPAKAIYIGDCDYEDRHAAEENGIRFIRVYPYFYNAGDEVAGEVEAHLAQIFGEGIIAKKTVTATCEIRT